MYQNIRIAPRKYTTSPADRISRLSCATRKGLAFLATHLFVFVTNAFAFVRFRFADAADFCRKLTYPLLVGPFDDDRGWIQELDLHSVGWLHFNGVSITHREYQGLLVHAGLVADSFDLEAFLKPFGDAQDHVGDQTAR